jgi:hypothetical protein
MKEVRKIAISTAGPREARPVDAFRGKRRAVKPYYPAGSTWFSGTVRYSGTPVRGGAKIVDSASAQTTDFSVVSL